jgi:signal transduction histidine kinase
LGVVAAIELLIDDQPPGGPSIDFRADVPFARLEPFVEGAIYRIVQEAITNIRRHSGSDRAQVRLTQFKDRLHVEVRDWGVGFDPKVIEGKRFGLRGICWAAGRRSTARPERDRESLSICPWLAPLGKSQLFD